MSVGGVGPDIGCSGARCDLPGCRECRNPVEVPARRVLEVQPYHGHMPYAPCAGGCGRVSTRDFMPVYADLDGPAFAAYYCRDCVYLVGGVS